MAAYVGLDPRKDINWVTHAPAESMQLLAEGKIDAFLGFPPQPQELRAKQIGHVVVNSAVGPPLVAVLLLHGGRATGSSSGKHPVATKRALRAILKAADICAARAGAGCPVPRGQGLYAELRLCPPDDEGDLRTASGASTTPRTPCASTPCACTRPG